MARVLPVILIIGLGNLVRTRGLISAQAIEQIKRLIVNIALPAVLFVAFLNMDLEASFFGLFATVLLVCLFLLGLGYLLRRAFVVRYDYYPFLMTGFEFGMVGITLFGTAYGLANVGYLAIVDLSHELFIWFVLATLLRAKRDGVSSLAHTLRGFATSPLIISIVSALVLNLLGASRFFVSSPLGSVVTTTFEILGGMLIPLILISIGYEMRLSLSGIRQAFGLVFLRLTLLIPAAFLLNALVVRRLLGLDPEFEAALFTFLILPPPYIVPLFMGGREADQRVYVNNVLSLYTVVTIAVFIIYFSLNPRLG